MTVLLSSSPPRVTIGIVSFNRLYYLRALIESARECVRYPNLQWIIVDGGSTEPGLRDYIESLEFVQHKVFRECTHPEAMNIIVEMAEGECLLLMPEDIQFIIRGPWMADLVELALSDPSVGHVTFGVQRRVTIARYFRDIYVRLRSRRYRLPLMRRSHRVYRAASGQEFLSYGNTRPGIVGSGINSFCRTEIWRRLGPWQATRDLGIANDSSLGAETDMLGRYARSDLRLQSWMMRYPVTADIVTDPRGTKARVRGGNRRYGKYIPPPNGRWYYRIWDASELRRFGRLRPAPGFEDLVQPLGYELPFDEQGNLLKTSVINDDEPFELVGLASNP